MTSVLVAGATCIEVVGVELVFDNYTDIWFIQLYKKNISLFFYSVLKNIALKHGGNL